MTKKLNKSGLWCGLAVLLLVKLLCLYALYFFFFSQSSEALLTGDDVMRHYVALRTVQT